MYHFLLHSVILPVNESMSILGPPLDNCDQRPPTYSSAVHGEAGYAPNQAPEINQPAHQQPQEMEDTKS